MDPNDLVVQQVRAAPGTARPAPKSSAEPADGAPPTPRQFFRDNMAQVQALSVSLGSSLAQVLPLGAGILFAFRGREESWQYLFIIEAVPTLLLAPLVFLCLPASPRAPGALLSQREREWLAKRCEEEEERERAAAAAAAGGGEDGAASSCAAFLGLLRDYRVLAVALIGFLSWSATTGLKYWCAAPGGNRRRGRRPASPGRGGPDGHGTRRLTATRAPRARARPHRRP